MSSQGRLHLLPRSVFARLIAVMTVMAFGLITLVMGFFWGGIVPVVHRTLNHVLDGYSTEVAAKAPDRAAALALRDSQGVEVRYEGPRGDWTTTADLPTIAQVENGELSGWTISYRDYRIRPAPQGGRYLFAWSFGGQLLPAHHGMVLLLLLVMVGVILITHQVLRRLLLPLRALGDGVERLGGGDLDVALPQGTPDEFGRLTAAFNAMAGRVREMIRSRDRLLLDVSHELRSPLTRMKVALELLPEGERRTKMAADVAEMEAMVTELLELERLRDGRALRRERRDLLAIVREVAESYRDRRPGVRLALPSDPVVLELDGEKVRAVLRNLLDNAHTHTLPDSVAVEVAVLEEEADVVVRVRDDGPGIPPDDLGHLFEPFFRADPSRSKRTGGYGLGLSICKRTMEAHGGSIAVENNPGRGATFTLRLPRLS